MLMAAASAALVEHFYADAKGHGASRVYWLKHETAHAAMQLCKCFADRSRFVPHQRGLA
jgi:hypothetical protein